jgi:hypothetical protein
VNVIRAHSLDLEPWVRFLLLSKSKLAVSEDRRKLMRLSLFTDDCKPRRKLIMMLRTDTSDLKIKLIKSHETPRINQLLPPLAHSRAPRPLLLLTTCIIRIKGNQPVKLPRSNA